jgi:hypothetical protein
MWDPIKLLIRAGAVRTTGACNVQQLRVWYGMPASMGFMCIRTSLSMRLMVSTAVLRSTKYNKQEGLARGVRFKALRVLFRRVTLRWLGQVCVQL